MPTYLISNRPPKDYTPSAEAMAAWNAWFEALGEHLVDRGNPVFTTAAVGAPATATRVGGYTLIRADDLDAAVALAERCPVLDHGGGVEVGELTTLNPAPAVDNTCVSTIYLHSTPGAVWTALTDPGRTVAYWAHHNVSDWRPGSRWEHQRADGSGIADIAGTVVACDPPTRLILTWANPVDGGPVAGAPARPADRPSCVTIEVEPHHDIVRLTVTHANLTCDAERAVLAAGWAAVLSNLKTYLETGHALPRPPWEMLPGFVRP